MKHIMKSIFVILMLTSILNSSFCQDRHLIQIKLEPGRNVLIDPGDERVNRLDIVRWEIAPGQNIKSFAIVGDDRHPFTLNLPVVERDQVERTIWKYAIRGDEWKYTIRCTLTDGTQIAIDPKIAVKPGVGIFELLFLLAFIVTIITSLVFFRKWQKAKAKPSEKSQQNT